MPLRTRMADVFRRIGTSGSVDLHRKPVRWTVVRLHQRYVVGSRAYWFAGVATTSRLCGVSRRRRPTLCRRRRRPSEACSGAVGDERGSSTWSKWVCTGMTASSRDTLARARQPSTRAADGAILPAASRARPGGRRSRRSSARTTRRRAAASPPPTTSPTAANRLGRQAQSNRSNIARCRAGRA